MPLMTFVEGSRLYGGSKPFQPFGGVFVPRKWDSRAHGKFRGVPIGWLTSLDRPLHRRFGMTGAIERRRGGRRLRLDERGGMSVQGVIGAVTVVAVAGAVGKAALQEAKKGRSRSRQYADRGRRPGWFVR